MAELNRTRVPGVSIIPLAVVALGLATTATLFGFITTTLEKRRGSNFLSQKTQVEREAVEAIGRQISFLHATAGLVAADPGIGQAKFTVFENNLVEGNRLPLPAEVGFVVSKPQNRREELIREAALRGVQGFRLPPAGQAAELQVVLLNAAFDGHTALPHGEDMAKDPLLAAAIRKTIAEKKAVVSIDSNDSHAPAQMTLFLPVIGTDSAQPLGVVYSIIRTDRLFLDLLKKPMVGAGDRDISSFFGVRIYAQEGRDRNLIFEQPMAFKANRHKDGEIPVDDLGLNLTAEYEASEGFDQPSVIGPYVLPVGSLVSVLLFLLATSLRRSQETAQRHANEQRLIADVGRQTSGSVDSDAVLNEVAHGIAEVFGVICRFDVPIPDGALRTVSSRTEHAELVAEIERHRPRLEKDEHLRKALATGETQRFAGYTPDDEEHRRRLEKLNAGAIVIVPMWARGRAVGAITLVRKIGEAPLSNDAVALLESIAGRMALAIDNARLYEDAQKEIVERRAAEAEVRRLNESLEEIVAERTRDLEASNQELESFCYSVSHDLRTPLRSLDGFGRALKEDYGDRLDAEGLDFIDRIRNSTKRMDELITALLTLSRLTRREIVPSIVDVTETIQDLAHDLDPEGTVEFAIDEGMTAKADPRMFVVVFENLLSNAVKFSSKSENPRIVVSQTPDGTISVKDNGAGFDPRYANKLFQPFERLHSVREFPGHGIGLATVERIVRRHGGEVRAESKPGEGATFFIRFPA